MATSDLLTRLESVRQVGDSRYLARCPAHEDKSPSLSIRETEDGSTLIWCFAGCPATDVIAAVGLEFSDLFPPRSEHRVKPGRPSHWHAASQALTAIKHEALIVTVAAGNIAHGRKLTDADVDRLVLAERRVRAALEACR